MKLRFLLVLALAAVAVDAALGARGPSIEVLPAKISYGQSITLQGKLPGTRRGQTVEVLAHGCGFTKAVVVAKVKVRRGGSIRYVAAPAFNMTYSLQWRGKKTRGVRVQVAPGVSLRKAGAGRYEVAVSSGGGSSFEGKAVLIQRRQGARWSTVGTVSLKLTSPPTALTAISSGSFEGSIAPNSRLRALFPKSQAGRCYRVATSASITS
jgi:hypothetical protein